MMCADFMPTNRVSASLHAMMKTALVDLSTSNVTLVGVFQHQRSVTVLMTALMHQMKAAICAHTIFVTPQGFFSTIMLQIRNIGQA